MIGSLVIPTKAVRRKDSVCREAKCNVPIVAISLEFRQGGGGKARHLRGAGLQGNLPYDFHKYICRVKEATPYATMRSIPSPEFSFSAPMGPCVRHA
ncbi:hypothetical protein NPIL_349091 [Nephila pilipes]|uniref:Uncharacterized protein n=1 Tax=Nephila pilipes TaxID=299642 RepID=A0A8X6QZG7_NEPPI|nr:hypothetical protein NPIL_349091 [Nephila pilipes]